MNTPSSLCGFTLELLESFLATFYATTFPNIWVVIFSLGIVEECDKFVVVATISNCVK